MKIRPNKVYGPIVSGHFVKLEKKKKRMLSDWIPS